MKNSSKNHEKLDRVIPEVIPYEEWSQKGKFENFQISSKQITKLKQQEIKFLFPIQFNTFKPIFKGKDLIGKDRTGSGKTLAFSLPLIEQKRKQNKFTRKNGQKPLILVILPTRELAIQVEKQFFNLKLDANEFRTLTIYGGTKYDYQESCLKQGVEIVVGTPGRLKDLLSKETLDFSDLEAIILDETDELLKMGFQQDIEEIIGYTSEHFKKYGQFLMFSATVPDWVVITSEKYMKEDKVFIDMVNSEENQSSKTLKHYYIEVENEQEKYKCIPKIIKEFTTNNRTIIFSNLKKCTYDISLHFKDQFKSDVLCGDVRQNQRERVIKEFQSNKIQVLVATDVAARGIHIDDLDLIIQFQPPRQVEQYIHRSGRTGRAGRKGVCVTLVDQDEYKDISKIKKHSHIKIEKLQKYKFISGSIDNTSSTSQNRSESFNSSKNSQKKGSKNSWRSNKQNGKFQNKQNYQKNDWKNDKQLKKKRQDESDGDYEKCKVFIGNLPFKAQESDLKSLLRKKNLNVSDIYFLKRDGQFTGNCFATFEESNDTQKALNMNLELKGRPLKINKAKKKVRI